MDKRFQGKALVQQVETKIESDMTLKKSQGCEVVEKVKTWHNYEVMLNNMQVWFQIMKTDAEQQSNVLIKQGESDIKAAYNKTASIDTRYESKLEGEEAISEKKIYDL